MITKMKRLIFVFREKYLWGDTSFLQIPDEVISVQGCRQNRMGTKVQQVRDEVESVRQVIAKAQAANRKRWPSTGRAMNYTVQSWEKEVERVNTFFDGRVVWMDNRIKNVWKK